MLCSILLEKSSWNMHVWNQVLRRWLWFYCANIEFYMYLNGRLNHNYGPERRNFFGFFFHIISYNPKTYQKTKNLNKYFRAFPKFSIYRGQPIFIIWSKFGLCIHQRKTGHSIGVSYEKLHVTNDKNVLTHISFP